jgi:elongation factor G
MAYASEQIRNIALVGHNSVGKTSVAEAMLLNFGMISRLGRIEEGSTVGDFDKEEIERRISLKTSLMNGDWNNHHINIMDTPGYADFIGDAKASIRVADGVVVVLDAASGVEIGMERVWAFGNEYKTPRCILINKMDKLASDPDGLLEQIRERFGRQAVPLQIALNIGEGFNQVLDLVTMKAIRYEEGKAKIEDLNAEQQSLAESLHEELMEAVAETDEELMEHYFSEGELSQEDLVKGLKEGVLRQEIFPVFYSNAYDNVGIAQVLDGVVQYFPSPLQSSGLEFEDADGNVVQLQADANANLSALVFKTVIEQHVGELSCLRIYGGTLKSGDEVTNASKDTNERIGQIFKVNGHERVEVNEAVAGDIVGLVKLKDTHTGNTLCAKGEKLSLPVVKFHEPLIRVAISPKERGQEDRMATGFAQMHEEDQNFVFKYDPQIRQTLLMAQGEMHLDSLIRQLKERTSVEVSTEMPRIPYQETIRGKGEGHHRHKKQSGGRGQYGEVFMRVAPKGRGEGFSYQNAVVGGNIPNNFIPAIEKGIVENMVEGPISGSSVVDVEATVYDGKFHAVDSDEVSFKIAGAQAFKDAFLKAKPVLLEPIYNLTITVPEEFMGDVMGDLSAKRGRVIGMDSDGHFQVVHAEAPLSEINRYATTLRSMTQGKGMHTQEFNRYEEAPKEVIDKVAAETAADKE